MSNEPEVVEAVERLASRQRDQEKELERTKLAYVQHQLESLVEAAKDARREQPVGDQPKPILWVGKAKDIPVLPNRLENLYR